MKRRFIYIFLLFLLFCPDKIFAQAKILNLRHWASPEHTRVVIDTSEEVQFTVEKSGKKVFLKLENAAIIKSMPREFALNQPGITKAVLFTLPGGGVGIEFFLADQVEANIFKLKKFQDKSDRVVMDIVLPEVEKEESRAREQIKVSKRDKIIVIDPGHGGEDPGAVGYRGTNEKDVVLKISEKVRDILNVQKGVRAFLTRKGDYYVSFKKRLNIARELGADLFISIHADAARNRKANGSSVYCLSTGGAGNEAARILAHNENLADIMGGTLGEGDSSDESDPIILNMFQTHTINQSKALGSKIINNLCNVNGIKFQTIQEAPFMVLKLPEIPAVLIETAYVSNPEEERKLHSKKFQTEIAQAILYSVRDFFSLPVMVASASAASEGEKTSSSPTGQVTDAPNTAVLEKFAPHTTVLKTKESDAPENPKRRTSVYKIKQGDTLEKIAAKYDTKIAVLLKMNKMKLKDTLYASRKLEVPLSEEAQDSGSETKKTVKPLKAKSEVIVHKVKKGETLDKIAREYQTSVAALLKLNHMKIYDPLYAGQNLDIALKIP